MKSYYKSSIKEFLDNASNDKNKIIGEIFRNGLNIDNLQKQAWLKQIDILESALFNQKGHILFEVKIPRIGKRIDNVVIIDGVVYVLEFKTTNKYSLDDEILKSELEQVVDYAVDLKNFHEGSYKLDIVPILISNKRVVKEKDQKNEKYDDGIYFPIQISEMELTNTLSSLTKEIKKNNDFNFSQWINSNYKPSPNIIEAAKYIYENHDVKEITTSDSGSYNLDVTTNKIVNIIENSKKSHEKSIIFLTGVPGSGKTLVGLNIPFILAKKDVHLYSAYLTGNGPLEKVLSESIFPNTKKKYSKNKDSLKSRIRNIHSFRDDALDDFSMVPIEKVVIFDEAQRAWNKEKTKKFLNENNRKDINQSEPEFLISIMNRHSDWSTIICLVGNGQEINTGESGVSEWVNSLSNNFKNWKVYLSKKSFLDSGVDENSLLKINYENIDELYLKSSLRSIRSEKLSELVNSILDLELEESKKLAKEVNENFKILITRDLETAKKKIKTLSRGSERYGMIASSQAYRMRSEGVNVKINVEPSNWYLKGKSDVRSSYYLEEAATEFYTQGLELDYTLVIWEADLRLNKKKWDYYKFRGTKWVSIRNQADKKYRLNAYRVLLTRARKGMVIYIPKGNDFDFTRKSQFYDEIYLYLRDLGIKEI
jgi:DUF2075 family protein